MGATSITVPLIKDISHLVIPEALLHGLGPDLSGCDPDPGEPVGQDELGRLNPRKQGEHPTLEPLLQPPDPRRRSVIVPELMANRPGLP